MVLLLIPGNNSVEEKLINVADVYDFMISQKLGKNTSKVQEWCAMDL